MSEKNTRIAIVNHDKCKPKKCRQECKKSCPVVRMGTISQLSSMITYTDVDVFNLCYDNLDSCLLFVCSRQTVHRGDKPKQDCLDL